MRGYNKKEEKKDSFWKDLFLTVPELLIYPIKWLFRGIFALIKFWN